MPAHHLQRALPVLAYRLEGATITNESHEQLPLISKLKLSLPTVEIGGLNTHLISSPSLTQWFQSLEDLSKYSLAKLVFELFDLKINAQLNQTLFNKTPEPSPERAYPSQVTLLVEHIFFALALRKRLASPSKHSIEEMRFVRLPDPVIRPLIDAL